MSARILVSLDGHDSHFVTALTDLGEIIHQVADTIHDMLGVEAFVRIGGVRRARLFTVRENEKVLVTTYTPDGSHAIDGFWSPS